MGTITFIYQHFCTSLDLTAKTKQSQRRDLHCCPGRERQREGRREERNEDHSPIHLKTQRSHLPDGERNERGFSGGSWARRASVWLFSFCQGTSQCQVTHRHNFVPIMKELYINRKKEDRSVIIFPPSSPINRLWWSVWTIFWSLQRFSMKIVYKSQSHLLVCLFPALL